MHYYEDGNIQLNGDKEIPAEILNINGVNKLLKSDLLLIIFHRKVKRMFWWKRLENWSLNTKRR